MTYSVLISVYKSDSPAYLVEALDSIYKNQIKKPDEIVIVEDGPVPDETAKVISAFSDSVHASGTGKVKVIGLKENVGLGAALKEGTKHCTCDYIFRMDTDDISVPERFKILSEYLEAHPEIDALGSDIGEFTHNPDHVTRKRVCPAKHEDILKMSKTRNPMNHVSAVIRRESLNKIGGYRALPLIEDYYLWVRMLAHGMKLANINQTLVKVRLGDGFDHRRGSKDRVKSWKVLQRYMISHGMIGRFRAFLNMISIRLFVYSPSGLKHILYGKLLRKHM